MKVKKVGFWKEEGYRKMPSIFEHINKHSKKKIPWRIFFYLHNSPLVSISMSAYSVIDNKNIYGDRICTDGKWIWSCNLIYYYEEHGLELPEEFVKHIKRRLVPYPIFFAFSNLLMNGRLVGKILDTCQKDADFASY